MRYWTILSAVVLAIGLGFLTDTSPVAAQQPANPAIQGDAEEFATADGVLLRGRFHPSKKGSPGSEATVIMMYAPGPDKDMTKNNWDELADKLATEGYNVLR